MSRTRAPLVGLGTVSVDTLETPAGSASDVLGGSAPYFGAAARIVSPVALLGVVGDDFPDRLLEPLATAGVDTRGIERHPGETFRWHARYEADGRRQTLGTNRARALAARPTPPIRLRDPGVLFLGSTDPRAQTEVLEALGAPGLVILDTMMHWIRDRTLELATLVARADVVVVSEDEALALGALLGTGRVAPAGAVPHQVAAERIRACGPTWVVVKRGPEGAVAFGPGQRLSVSAAPALRFLDPTGAGDAFAGGLAATLAVGSSDAALSAIGMAEALRAAAAAGSFAVESFSVARLLSVTADELASRVRRVRIGPRPPASP